MQAAARHADVWTLAVIEGMTTLSRVRESQVLCTVRIAYQARQRLTRGVQGCSILLLSAVETRIVKLTKGAESPSGQ